jgi:glycosyltransferase involved in cell wall biosynthesis
VLDHGGAPQYVQPLRQALVRLGVEVIPVPLELSAGHVRAHHRECALLHLHFPHSIYSAPDRSTMLCRLQGWAEMLQETRRLGMGIVWTVHNLLPHDRPHPDLQRLARRYLCEHASGLIAHCARAAQQVERQFWPPVPCTVIPHGRLGEPQPLVERAAARRELRLAETDLVFLHVGMLRPYKGLWDLVDTFGRLRAPHARLIVAGRPWPGSEAALSLARADPRISVMDGYVPDARLPWLFAAADFVVLPYVDVLTSGSAILAGDLGRRVIAPAIGCIPETVDLGAAILYDARRPDGLLGALHRAVGEALTWCDSVRSLTPGWDEVAARTIPVYRTAAMLGISRRGS